MNSASVHVRDFRQSEWMSYNGSEPFDPGSMLKLPLMMMYLGMADEDPDVLRRTWTCEPVDCEVPQHTAFPSAQAQLNTTCTVEQVLELAIAHSDNRATVMLFRHISLNRYVGIYTDPGLPKTDRLAKSYRLTARAYSVFMKALYNSSLLSPMGSERALGLMTRSTFRSGLVAGLPPDVEIAHEFGEAGDPNERQLHESGLVYAQCRPYLIMVMTRGAEPYALADAIASISRVVYDRMAADQGLEALRRSYLRAVHGSASGWAAIADKPSGSGTRAGPWYTPLEPRT